MDWECRSYEFHSMDHRNLVCMNKHRLEKKKENDHFSNYQDSSNELVGLVAVQVPPLRHGCDAHGLIKIAQVGPVY